MNRLTLVLLIVATAAVASLATLVLAPDARVNAQGLVTTRAPDKVVQATAAALPSYQISSYGYVEPPQSRRDEAKWTLGFFVMNTETHKVSNCIYMWSGSPMNKCIEYGWVKLP